MLHKMCFPQTQLHKVTTVGRKVATPLKTCVLQVNHWQIIITINHNKHKHFDHCLWFCRMAWTTRIFPSWLDISRGKNPANSRGKSCYPCHWAECRLSVLFGQVITVLERFKRSRTHVKTFSDWIQNPKRCTNNELWWCWFWSLWIQSLCNNSSKRIR